MNSERSAVCSSVPVSHYNQITATINIIIRIVAIMKVADFLLPTQALLNSGLN